MFYIKDRWTLQDEVIIATRIVVISQDDKRRTPPKEREMTDKQDVYLIRM